MAQNGYGAKEFINDISESADNKDASATPMDVRQGIIGVLKALLSQNGEEAACDKDITTSETYCFFHYLSSNPDFDYLYGYLAHSYEKYRDTLRQAGKALQSIFADIDTLMSKPESPDRFSVVFDGFLSFSFEGGKPTASFIWDNSDKLYRLKDKYYVSAFKGKDLRGTILRKSEKDIDRLIEML